MKKNPEPTLFASRGCGSADSSVRRGGLPDGKRPKKPLPTIISWSGLSINILFLFTLTSCNHIVTDRYEATALVTYTWQVAYTNKREKFPRRETFATNSLLNQNGQKPEGAVTGPDEQGLWWPALPPRPTVDEIEAKQQPDETPGSPELLKQVTYHLTYQLGAEMVKLPTNYQVYRQVAKAYPARLPLKFTLGLGNGSVEQASPK